MIDLTVLILTYNEKENIERVLRALAWAERILILDSGSLDDTIARARAAHTNIEVLTRPFDTFAAQCNFGLAQISTPWVLSVDADYVVTPELSQEIKALTPLPETAG